MSAIPGVASDLAKLDEIAASALAAEPSFTTPGAVELSNRIGGRPAGIDVLIVDHDDTSAAQNDADSDLFALHGAVVPLPGGLGDLGQASLMSPIRRLGAGQRSPGRSIHLGLVDDAASSDASPLPIVESLKRMRLSSTFTRSPSATEAGIEAAAEGEGGPGEGQAGTLSAVAAALDEAGLVLLDAAQPTNSSAKLMDKVKAEGVLAAAEKALTPIINLPSTWRAAQGGAAALAYTLLQQERPQLSSAMVEHWLLTDANLSALTDAIVRPLDLAMHAGAGSLGQYALAAQVVQVSTGSNSGLGAMDGSSSPPPPPSSAYGVLPFALAVVPGAVLGEGADAQGEAQASLSGSPSSSPSPRSRWGVVAGPPTVYSHAISRLRGLALDAEGGGHAAGGLTGLGAVGMYRDRSATASTADSWGVDVCGRGVLEAELSHALLEIIPRARTRSASNATGASTGSEGGEGESSFPLGIAAAQAAAFASALTDLPSLAAGLSTALGLTPVDATSSTQAPMRGVSLLHPRMQEEVAALGQVQTLGVVPGGDVVQEQFSMAAAAELAAVKRSFRAVRLLCSNTALAEELMDNRAEELTKAAFSVFSSRAKGSAAHACTLLQRLLQVHPEAVARTAAADSQRYIGSLLPYLHHSPVADTLVQLVSMCHLHSSHGGAGPCADMSGGFRNTNPFSMEGGGFQGMFGMGSMGGGWDRMATSYEGSLPLYCSRGVVPSLVTRFILWKSLAGWGFLHVLASHVYLPEYGPVPEHIECAADALLQIIRVAASDERGDLLLKPLGRIGGSSNGASGLVQGLLLGAVAPLPGVDYTPGKYCADGVVPARQLHCMRVISEVVTLSYADTVMSPGDPGGAPTAGSAPSLPGTEPKHVANRVAKYAAPLSSATVAALPRLGAALVRIHKVMHPGVATVPKPQKGATATGHAGDAGAMSSGAPYPPSTASVSAANGEADKKRRKKEKKKKKKAAAAAAAAASATGLTGSSSQLGEEQGGLITRAMLEENSDDSDEGEGLKTFPSSSLPLALLPLPLPTMQPSMQASAGLFPPPHPSSSSLVRLHPGHTNPAPFGSFRLAAVQLIAAVIGRRNTLIPTQEPLPRPPATPLHGSGEADKEGRMGSPGEGGLRGRDRGASTASGTDGIGMTGPTPPGSVSIVNDGDGKGDDRFTFSEGEGEGEGHRGKADGKRGRGKGKSGGKNGKKGGAGRGRATSNVSNDSGAGSGAGGMGGAHGHGTAGGGAHGSHLPPAKSLLLYDAEERVTVNVSTAALDALSAPALLVPVELLAAQVRAHLAQAQTGDSLSSPSSSSSSLLPSVYDPQDLFGCLVTWVTLYPHTNMYHVAFYSFLQSVLLARHDAGLSLLLRPSRLLSTFLAHYEATTDSISTAKYKSKSGPGDGSSSPVPAQSADGTLIVRMDIAATPSPRSPASSGSGMEASGRRRQPYAPKVRHANGSSARGIILRCLNAVRLTALSEAPTTLLSQHLRDHVKWTEFQGRLREENLALSKPLVPAPSRPGAGGGDGGGLSGLPSGMSAILRNMLNPSAYSNLVAQGGNLLAKLQGSPGKPGMPAFLAEEPDVLGLGSPLAKELGLIALKAYAPPEASSHGSGAGAGGGGGWGFGGKGSGKGPGSVPGTGGSGGKPRSGSSSSTSSSGSVLSLMPDPPHTAGGAGTAAGTGPVVAKKGPFTAGKVVPPPVTPGTVRKSVTGAWSPLKGAAAGASAPPLPTQTNTATIAGGLHDVD